MGYAFMLGSCFVCGGRFSFNPMRVPSFKDSKGVRQPVCLACITEINVARTDGGVDAFIIPDDAYDPCNEDELG